ncbi:MAG: chromate transporter [Clostridium sp.]|nr:chromate transporter [Clostridium sp.]
MSDLFKMFITFFKIGAFTFGGGYAMIPLIEEEVVNKEKWVDKQEFVDMIVISQSLPGPLALNCSTFIGYKISGVLGAIMAVLGITLPSFLIITLIATYFMRFRDNYYVNLAFKGISAAVPMLVLVGVVSMIQNVKKNIENAIILVVALICLVVFKISPVIVTIAGAVYGIIFCRKRVK